MPRGYGPLIAFGKDFQMREALFFIKAFIEHRAQLVEHHHISLWYCTALLISAALGELLARLECVLLWGISGDP